MKKRIFSIMDTRKKKVGIIIICAMLITMVGTAFALTANLVAQNEISVEFYNMDAIWDTGWGDDEFFVKFAINSNSTISEYGIKCWDSKGAEIKYIDGPSSPHDKNYYHGYGFCIGAINTDGSHIGSLVKGETYNWIVYVVVDGQRYESQTNSFIYSTQGSRFGK